MALLRPEAAEFLPCTARAELVEASFFLILTTKGRKNTPFDRLRVSGGELQVDLNSSKTQSKDHIMEKSVFIAKGILISSIVSGPVFVGAYLLSDFYSKLPEVIPVDFRGLDVETISAMLGFALLVVMFGSILALLPNTLGALVLGKLGRHSEMARSPLTWAATGTAMAAISLALTAGFEGDQRPLSAALIITSCICALICHRFTRWAECAPRKPIPAPASVSPPAQSELGHRNTGARLLD
jgi:hypothetical protein